MPTCKLSSLLLLVIVYVLPLTIYSCIIFYGLLLRCQCDYHQELVSRSKGSEGVSNCISYSGKFSYGANFRIFRMLSLHIKIKTTKICASDLWPTRHDRRHVKRRLCSTYGYFTMVLEWSDLVPAWSKWTATCINQLCHDPASRSMLREKNHKKVLYKAIPLTEEPCPFTTFTRLPFLSFIIRVHRISNLKD